MFLINKKSNLLLFKFEVSFSLPTAKLNEIIYLCLDLVHRHNHSIASLQENKNEITKASVLFQLARNGERKKTKQNDKDRKAQCKKRDKKQFNKRIMEKTRGEGGRGVEY